MKRFFLATGLALLAAHAAAQQASWSGSSEMVTTITGQPGIKCGYLYNGLPFDRVFKGSNCPSLVEVEVPQSSPPQGLIDCQFVAPYMHDQCMRANERRISGRQ